MIEDSIVNQEQKVYRKILNSKEKTEQYMEEMYTEVNKYYGEGVKEKGKTGVNWIQLLIFLIKIAHKMHERLPSFLDIEQIMEGLDKERTGYISKENMKPLLFRLIEIKAGLAPLDCLFAGQESYSELLENTQRINYIIKKIFNAIDLNDDNYIQIDELRDLLNQLAEPLQLPKITDEQLNVVFYHIAKERPGNLNQKEFKPIVVVIIKRLENF